MQIRTRLTLQFVAMVAIILILASLAIYFFSVHHRREDFYSRLHNKASNTAQLLIEFEEVDLDLLKRIEAINPVSLPNEKIIIYDFRNHVIYSTDEQRFLRIKAPMLDEIRLREKLRFSQGDHEVLGFLFTGPLDRFVVIIAAVDIFGIRKMQNLRNILVGVVGFSIVLLLVTGWMYSGRMLRPISRVISQVDEISIARLDLRLDEGNQQDEIARLAATFNKMLDRLETAFNSQKQFINNASHELRTPLTAITGQLEVMLMQKRSPEEMEKVISSVLDDMRNLANISNRLLMLAQASAGFSDLSLSPLRLDEVIWQVREDLMKHHLNYRIHIEMDASLDDDSKMTLKGDEPLIRTLIANLMENGCKYSPDNKVTVFMSAEDHSLLLSFADEGIGITPEDLDYIFEPFRRGQNALHIKGHGIGLSLVEGITRLHKGRISVESVINQGTIFRLSLPQSRN